MQKYIQILGKILAAIGAFLFIYNIGMAHLLIPGLPYSKAVNLLIVLLILLFAAGLVIFGLYLIMRNPEKPWRIRKNEIPCPREILDDVTYIREIHHTTANGRQQYDFLLAARRYGWDYMVSSAEYMIKADLNFVDSISVSESGQTPTPRSVVFSQYETSYTSIEQIRALDKEYGTLRVSAKSRTLASIPIRIIWFNQMKMFRIKTYINDEEIMRRYAETLIRRTFGTPDAMKLAKPLPKADPQ